MAEREGNGVSRKNSRKFSRSPVATAFRNEERREREVVADNEGGKEEGRESRRPRSGQRGDQGRRGTKKEGAKRERSQKWRKKRNGECTQHQRVRKRAFREYRSSPLDGLTRKAKKGKSGWKKAGGDDGGRGWKRGEGGGKEDE